MKNLKPWLIAFGILAVVAIALYLSDHSGTFRKSQIDFAIQNINEIKKVVIIYRADTFELKNQSGSWVYNNLIVARKAALVNLFRLLNNINAKAPIRGNFDEQFINGASISIFDNDKLIKKYIIAEDTIKHLSIGQIEGSDKVFEIEAVGFPPRLLPFYRTDNRWWRDKVIFGQNPEQIISISVENNIESNLSYTIRNYGKGRYGIVQGKSDKLLQNVSSDKLIQYLKLFTNIEISDYIETDSVENYIASQNLLYSMTIESISGESFYLQAFEKKGDPNQLFLLINRSQLSVGKYVVFDLLFEDPDYFCK